MKIIKRIIIYIILLLITPVTIISYIVSQPSIAKNTPSNFSVDPDKLKTHVLTISSNFYPRSYRDWTNLSYTADYIRSHLSKSGAVLTNQIYIVQGHAYENIVAIFPSTNLRTIVIGAHYDACSDTPGADDNSSGVAGLLELADLLGKTKLNHTVEVVAYCTEEPPFFGSPDMGSAHHAKYLREANTNIMAMIALEMIGYFSTESGTQKYPAALFRLLYPSAGNFISIVGNTRQRELIRQIKSGMQGATDLPVYSISVPQFVQGVDYSDHMSFWNQGFPAVMITDTGFIRNNQYHKSGDTTDRLDYNSIAKVVVEVYEAVKKLDE